MGSSGNKEVEVDAKWDACVDLTLRRFLYSSFGGAFGALLLFRTPTTRWATVAFGAGLGIGSAYTECCRLLDDGSPFPSPPPTNLPPPPPPKVPHTPIQNVQDPE